MPTVCAIQHLFDEVRGILTWQCRVSSVGSYIESVQVENKVTLGYQTSELYCIEGNTTCLVYQMSELESQSVQCMLLILYRKRVTSPSSILEVSIIISHNILLTS